MAAGLLDDAVDGGEPEPGAAPDFLGGEERLEDLLHHLRRHAGAGVAHFDQHVFAGLHAVLTEGEQVALGDIGGADRELAAVRHGVARIHRKIDDHLLELMQVRLHRPDVGAAVELQLDVLAEQPPEQDRQLRQHVAELHALRPQGLLAREGKQLAHEPGGAVRVLLDVHDVLEGRIGRPVIHQEEV